MPGYQQTRRIWGGTWRSNYRTKNRFRKRRFGNRWPRRSLAGKAFNLAKKALVQNKPEIMNTDATATISVVGGTPSIVNIGGATQGVTENMRKGNEMKYVDLLARIIVQQEVGNTVTTNVRYIILLDRQPNGAVPAITQVLATSASIISPLNRDYRLRFQILVDKIYTLNNSESFSTNETHYRRLTGIKETYNGLTSAIVDISTNSLIQIIMSDSPGIGNICEYFTRVKFTDA